MKQFWKVKNAFNVQSKKAENLKAKQQKNGFFILTSCKL